MLSTTGQWFSAEYDTFVVMDEEIDFYRIWVSGFSGDCGDAMEFTGILTIFSWNRDLSWPK